MLDENTKIAGGASVEKIQYLGEAFKMYGQSLKTHCGTGTGSCFPLGALRVWMIAEEDYIGQEYGRELHISWRIQFYSIL